jgi:hypothetical protein
MPVQVNENKFVEFRDDPDYLQGIKKTEERSRPILILFVIQLAL